MLAQRYPRIEVLVVDNASSDDGVDLIKDLAPPVRVIRLQRNLGYAGGNNGGFAECRGQYVAVLNPDTEVEPDWLAALVDALERDPSAGLATSKILLFDRRDRVNTCGNEIHLTGLTFCRGLGAPAAAYSRPERVAAVSGAAFLIRRSLLATLGGFNERFFMYLEDTDLSWRAALAGYECLLVPTSIVYHHYAVHVSARKTFYLERNRYLMLLQNCRVSTLALLAPALLFGEVITWSYLAARGPAHIAAKLRAYGWLARNRAEWSKTRQRVQQLRRVGDGPIMRRFGYRLALDQLVSGWLLALARPFCDGPFYVWRRFITMVVP